MAGKLRAFISKIGYTTASFVLAVSTLTAAVPFILSQDVSAATTVNSQSELVAAIAGSDTEIELGSSFSITSQVNINRTVLLDGNGFTLSGTYTATGGGNDSILAVVGGSPTITDLIVDGASGTDLQGIQVWNSTANLINVTARNNNKAGVHVNNATVTVNNITTSNNSRGKATLGISHFGGIVISSGTLTVNGMSTHTSEGNHIRRDGGTVVDTHAQYSTLTLLGVTRYTLKAAPAAPTFVSPTPANNATITDTQDVTVSWNKPTYASTFEYRINGGAPVATSAQTFSQTFANGTYTVEVRSVAASGLAGNWSPVRTFTVSYYAYAVNDSKFVGSPKYVQANGAHASHNISAEVHVPVITDEVQFSLNGGSPIAGTYINTVNASSERWRLITPLAPGEYTITAQYRVNGVWYDVTGNGTVYSIDAPTAQYVTPSDTKNIFRPSDNPIRLKVEDQYEQFSRMVVTIGSTSYEVVRANCDLRQAGNYLFCDVDASATWSGLADGVYTASTTTYTKANNRVDNLVSRQFTIDSEKPVLTSLNAPAIVSSTLAASATATDNVELESVNFYVTAPRHDGVCTGNGTKLVESRILGSTGNYNVSLDTSALNGEYCLSAVARDEATNNSTVISKKVIIDNLDPIVSIDNLVISTGATKRLSFDLKATDENSGLQIVAANIYNATNTGSPIITLGSGNPTRLNVPHAGLAIGTGLFETSLTNIDVSSLASGTYTIRAYARDHAGNEHRFLLTQFTVDNTAPVITLIGGDETVEMGSVYVDQGATALDAVDGDVTASIIVTNPVDSNVIGTYTVTYTVTDTAGNSSSTTRTVTVVDTTAPSATITTTGTQNTATPVIEGAVDTDVVALEFYIDGVLQTTGLVWNPGDATWSFTGVTFANGDYNLQILARDASNNEGGQLAVLTVEVPVEDDGETPAGPASSTVTPGDVLGDQDTNPDLTPEDEEDVQGAATDKAAQAADTGNDSKIFGLDWYWWLLIVAAVAAGLWWLIAALRRRSAE